MKVWIGNTKKKAFKEDAKICGLKTWVDDGIVYWDGEDLGGAKFGRKTEVDSGHVYNETEERTGAGEED